MKLTFKVKGPVYSELLVTWYYHICFVLYAQQTHMIYVRIFIPLLYSLVFVPFAQYSPEEPVHDPQWFHHVHAF